MIVVYTAIFGGSDSLKRPPPADRCVCFTDDLGLAGKGWEIVQVPPHPRPRRGARLLKMRPRELFPDADATIWVDGSIEIHDFAALLADIGDAEIACFPHPDRSNCYDEGETVIRLKIAYNTGKDQVRQALAKYRSEGFAPKQLSTTGLLYRRNTDRTDAFNDLWRDELHQYGTNDQVHVDYCAWKAGATVHYLRGTYQGNPYAQYDRADHHKRRKPQFLLERDCKDYLA